jgi:hypothetical protein
LFANKGMIKEKLSGTYNEHLQGLILKPLGGKEIIVIESDGQTLPLFYGWGNSHWDF